MPLSKFPRSGKRDFGVIPLVVWVQVTQHCSWTSHKAMPSAMCGFPERTNSHKNTTGSVELIIHLDREMRREYAQKISQNALRLVFKSPSPSSFQKPSYFSTEHCFISPAQLPAELPHGKLLFLAKWRPSAWKTRMWLSLSPGLPRWR